MAAVIVAIMLAMGSKDDKKTSTVNGVASSATDTPLKAPKFDSEERTWEKAKANNTPDGYAIYLKNYPKGRYAELAIAAQQKALREVEPRAPNPEYISPKSPSVTPSDEISRLLQVRQSEINSCQHGEMITWGGEQDMPAVSKAGISVFYDPIGSPEWLSPDVAINLIRESIVEWSKCGVKLSYAESNAKNTITVSWIPSIPNAISSVDIANRKIKQNFEIYKTLQERNPKLLLSTFQMSISHELGAFLGLRSKSRRCVDVMAHYHDNQGNQCITRSGVGIRSIPGLIEYRHSLPTACDLARCRSVNSIQ